jgi:hypothetical protein
MLRRSPIVYCDLLNNPPTVNLKTLGDLVIRYISTVAPDHCIISDECHHVLHIVTQPNGTDCGFCVMLTIWMMVEEFIQGSDSTDFVSMARVLNNDICYCKSRSKCVHWCRVRSNGSDSKMWSSFENVGKMGTPDFGLSHILTGGNVILCNIKYMISVYYQAFLYQFFVTML